MRNNNFIYFFLTVVIIMGSSCKKYLDVNNNPNQPIASTAQLLIPQAITATATNLFWHDRYGGQASGMYMANAGGYGGFGSNVTYNYSVTDYNELWGVYDVNEDFYQAKELSKGDASLIYYNAISRIMLAHNFQLVVDAYNSVPYTEALQGASGITRPKFDDPAAIYTDLAKQLDTAIADINAGQKADVAPVKVTEGQDPMFAGNMDMWKKFANTVKLRLMVTGNGKVIFSNTTFDPIGFLEEDAMINPGFARDNGKQNPKWNTWAYSYTGADGNKAWMPSTFILAFYNNARLSDPGRGRAIYYQFPCPTNRLGFEDNNSVNASPAGSFWYPSSNRTGSSAGHATGVLKGPDAGIPVITAAESYFLQAEAMVRGIITSTSITSKQLFKKGISASFRYLYELPDGTVSGNPDADTASYFANTNNAANYIVNFDLATTTDQKIEAIITQKFIALNMVNSNQSWNDYRRTHYPVLVNAAGATGVQTFASTQSLSQRADHLYTRLPYPSAVISNNQNTPNGISPFTSLIFWALP